MKYCKNRKKLRKPRNSFHRILVSYLLYQPKILRGIELLNSNRILGPPPILHIKIYGASLRTSSELNS